MGFLAFAAMNQLDSGMNDRKIPTTPSREASTHAASMTCLLSLRGLWAVLFAEE